MDVGLWSFSIMIKNIVVSLLCVLAVQWSPLVWAEELTLGEKPSDFVRISKLEGKRQPQSLDTAVVSFTDPKTGVTVDLFGAIHIGDKEYYAELNERFKDYDALLYELVAEPDTIPAKTTAQKQSTQEKSLLSDFQTAMGRSLALDFQLEHIDYAADNFVHADLSPDEFAKRISERGDVLQTLYRAVVLGLGKENGHDEFRTQGRLLATFFSSDPTLQWKRFFAKEMLQQVDELNWVIAGNDGDSDGEAGGSSIISDRNAAALQVLRREMRNGKKKLAIFYGAAHLPEFVKSLKQEFQMTPSGISWIKAWDLSADRSARR